MKRKIIITGCIIVAVILSLIEIIPFRCSRTLDALEVDLGNEGYCISRSIVIEGYYHVNYFRKNTFTGKIQVDGYPVTDNDLIHPVEIAGGNLDLLYKDNPVEDRRFYFGRLFSDTGMTRLIIVLSGAAVNRDADGGGVNISENSGRYIVAEADSRDEAIRRIYKIIDKFIY